MASAVLIVTPLGLFVSLPDLPHHHLMRVQRYPQSIVLAQSGAVPSQRSPHAYSHDRPIDYEGGLRGYGPVVFRLLVALPLIRIVLRGRDLLRVLKISVGEPQRITSAPPAASSQEPKMEADEDGRAQGWSAADAWTCTFESEGDTRAVQLE